MQSTVYLITCPLGLRYVGGTTQKLKNRLSKHRSERSECRLIRDAIHIHGWENMKISILMTCPVDSLEKNESLYIEALDTVHPRGYNLRCGSKAGAPSPGGMEVSTFVLDPTEATDEMRKAVQEDIEEITGTRPLAMTWCGPVSVSIGDLNRMRGATMNLPWAGPVKGIPVDVTATQDIDMVRRMESEKIAMDNVAANSKRLEEELSLSMLTSKIEKCERLGMQEEVVTLKRKLVELREEKFKADVRTRRFEREQWEEEQIERLSRLSKKLKMAEAHSLASVPDLKRKLDQLLNSDDPCMPMPVYHAQRATTSPVVALN